MVRKCGGKKTAKGRKKKTERERERNKVRGLFIGANIKKRKKKLLFHFQVVKPSFPAKSSLRRDRREREREKKKRRRGCVKPSPISKKFAKRIQ